MSYKVFSLKYRPQNFDELIGQDHVRVTLCGAIKKGKVGHAYLFAGPRGVGKTTVARILAKSLNCATGLTIQPCGKCASCVDIAESRSIDVLEIDGASNRRIEDIRELRENVKYAPAYSRHKVYIIDEVHMLTEESFNALLKTLEEPPAAVIFIFATTEPAAVPGTILSRCQRFDFRRLSPTEIHKGLAKIVEHEKIKVTTDTLMEIARRADGSMRDAESLLEQLVSFADKEIKREDLQHLFGMFSPHLFFDLFDALLAKDPAPTIGLLSRWFDEGANPFEVYTGVIRHLRGLLLVKLGVKEIGEDYETDELKKLTAQAGNYDVLDLIRMIQVTLDFENACRLSMNTRIALELLILRLGFMEKTVHIADLVKHLEGLRTDEPTGGSVADRLVYKVKESRALLGSSLEKARISLKNGKEVEFVFDFKDKYHKEVLEDKMNHAFIEKTLEDLMKTKPSIKVILEESKPEPKDERVDKVMEMFDGEEVR